jgi:hypothetical protein
MDADSDQQDQNVRKIFQKVTIPWSVTPNDIYHQMWNFFQNWNVIKMYNNPDPDL